jgi:hypothetical protein
MTEAPRNPYAPPQADVSDLPPGEPGAQSPFDRLFSPGQVMVATFLGAFLAGAWFYAQNLAALGKPELKRKAMLVGLGVTILAMGLSLLLPSSIPNIIPPIVCAAGAGWVTNSHFGKIVAAHVAAGGKLGSWWSVVGISLLFALGIFAAIVAVMVVLLSRYVPK